MKAIITNNYHLDNKTFSATCDEKPLSLYVAASKARAVSFRSFNFLEKIYFYFLDLIASIGLLKAHRYELLKENIGEIEKVQNIFLKKRKELAQFVSEHYTRIAGNVEHLDEAEVIGLGETHIVEDHRVRNAKVIDELAEPGDLILLEYDERDCEEARVLQAGHVKSVLPIMGWDDRSGGSTDAAIKIQINALAGVLASPFFMIHTISNPVVGAISALSYYGYLKWDSNKASEIIDRELPMRNESMCKRVDENRKEDRRIYVIAGSNHFSRQDLRLGKTSENQEKMYDLTVDSFKDKKFVLLVPKDIWS